MERDTGVPTLAEVMATEPRPSRPDDPPFTDSDAAVVAGVIDGILQRGITDHPNDLQPSTESDSSV